MDKKLLETCEQCIHDEPAATTAWCPIHVDVAAFNAEMEKGDFKKAYKILEKRMPFAGIIGMICDHPCEKACVRNNLDRSIAVSELERAAVTYGYTPYKKGLTPPQSAGTAAIIGGGISGITAAFELNKKNFKVTIYEKSDKLGGSIWNYQGQLIEKEKIENELKIVEKLGIEVRFNHQIGKSGLEKLISEYNVVYLGTGDWEEEIQIDPETFQVDGSSVFAGGRLFNKNDSVIYAVSTGKRAAVSMERYVKKFSLNASREKEGSYETPLKYSLENVKPAERVKKSAAVYTQEEAKEEAKRCLKCRCVECQKACAHLKKYNMVPKTYGRQIYINENVIMGTRYANKMINSCTMCGLCDEQCPSGIGMKELIRQTRQSMVAKGKMPISAHDFALKDMEFSNSNQFFMVKSPPPIPAEEREAREKELFTYPRLVFSKYAQSLFKGDSPGKEKADYLFYPGCQLSASYPEYVEKSYQYLVSNIKEGVGIMLGCCGAPADWAGRQDLVETNMKRFRDTWEEMGKPTFILACSSCSAIFEKYLSDIPIISLWEIFDRYGLPSEAKNGNGHVLSVHDACSTRNNKNIHDSLRNIADKLGYEIQELKYSKEKTKCCGYGGLVYFANREQSNEFVKERIDENDNDYLVYCAMCKDLFVDSGKRTFHILDLIFGDNMDEAAHRKMPNLSQRHANRAQLKKKLLKEFWNEDTENESVNRKDLIIPDDVWRTMDERYILLEDVEKVILHAQETGERFFNPQNSNYLASQRIGDVTYWVRYAEKDGKIQVISVYSHRMEVAKE
ncbi:MAG TPA: FAD-dependent oxidoreductase [Caproicibacter sp.]|nr:FAD-dependent oxidoreductase [Caproicibacter sp.]